MTSQKSKKIYIAGHRGMVGSAIVRQLQAAGHDNLITRTHAELDLTNQTSVNAFFATEKPDQVYLAAAKVGGIRANNTYPAEFIYQNLMIEANIIQAAHANNVQKLLFLGSSCIYPKAVPQPMREDALLTGVLEPTNEPYAIAKIAGIKLCESYNRQYGQSHGRDYRSAMPTNLYGPNDNYDLANSHVLPALIRKAHEAKISGMRTEDSGLSTSPLSPHPSVLTPELKIWGTGTPKREFLYVYDMADACVFLMEHNISEGIYNIGSGTDVTIRELAETVMDVIGFQGKIVFDSSKPDGTMRKLLDVSRMKQLGWQAKTGLRAGIKQAYTDFLATLNK